MGAAAVRQEPSRSEAVPAEEVAIGDHDVVAHTMIADVPLDPTAQDADKD